MELTKWTALELGAAIKKGEVSVREAAQAALDAVAARDMELNAFITVTGERALERADALQAGVKDAQSPLYGVPMAIKDNICTKGVKTSCASKILGEFAPPYDAAVVERLADAGAVSLGKLNMDEFAMRSKENAQDYRYFPEPDLPPIELSQEYLDGLRAAQPELAEAKRARYQADYGLPAYDCQMITSDKALAAFFETLVELGAPPKQGANWIMGEVLGALSLRGMEPKDMKLTPPTLARLISLVGEGRLNRNTAVKVFEAVFDAGGDVDAYVKEHGLEQVNDDGLVREVCARVLDANPQSVADYQGGKEKAFGFLVGQVMRELKGKANPQTVNQLLKELLQ